MTAVFNKKGGGAAGAGSGPLRWLPVGQNFNLLRLMFQAPGSPSGSFKNPAYKSYIAKISNEPLDFLLPDRSIIAARCVWIISGGRPSQHGFHLVIVSTGRENLQRLTGQEGVSSRHFSAELIAEAAKADASERPAGPRTAATGVTIKPKPKPSKVVDDFSDLSGDSDSSPPSFLDEGEKPASRAAAKAKATDLGGDDFLSAPDDGMGGAAGANDASTDLSDIEAGEPGASVDLDFQKYTGDAKAKPEEDSEFFAAPAAKKPAKKAAPVSEDHGFLSDGADDLIAAAPGGRTWSLDDDGSSTQAKPAAEAAPAEEMAAGMPEEPAAEAPAEPEAPEEPMEAAVAEAAPVAEENPFEADLSGPAAPEAAPSAPPIEAEAIPEDDPFAEFDRKPEPQAAAPEPAAAPVEAPAENPFDEFGGETKAAAPSAPESSISDDMFEEHPQAAVAAEALKEELSPAPATAAGEETPGWDLSDERQAAAQTAAAADAAAAPEPAAEPVAAPISSTVAAAIAEPDAVQAPEPVPVAAEPPPVEPPAVQEAAAEHDEFAGDSSAAGSSAAAVADEEPVAMDDFSADADAMAARVAGETDASDLMKPAAPSPAAAAEAPVAMSPELPMHNSGMEPAPMAVDGSEPMFAEETEAALGEVEDLMDPEALIARAAKKAQPAAPAPVTSQPAAGPPAPGSLPPGEEIPAYAHDDVAYFADLPKDAHKGSDILSAEARKLAAQAAAPVSAPAISAPAAPADDEPVAMGSEMEEEPGVVSGAESAAGPGSGTDDDKIAAHFGAKDAPAAFEDEAVPVGDEVSDAEDLFGDRNKVAKLDTHEFPHEAGNGRDHDSEKMADLRYTNLNTDADTEKAIAEADSIMSAEDFFKEEVAAVTGEDSTQATEPVSAPAPEPSVGHVTLSEPPAPVASSTPPAPVVISGPPEPELVAKPPSEPPVSAPVSTPPAMAATAAKPEGAWRKFTGDVSTELKNKAKQSKIVERAPDMIRFDLKVRVLWPSDGLTEGTLCVKDRAPSLWLSAADIRKITPEAEVEF